MGREGALLEGFLRVKAELASGPKDSLGYNMSSEQPGLEFYPVSKSLIN